MVTAVGVVVTDASDDTAAEVDVGDRLGVPVNQLPSADDAPPADEAAAALMADVAAAEATAPCGPAGKFRHTPAVVDPGAMSTVTLLAPGKRARAAACTAAALVAFSGYANMI